MSDSGTSVNTQPRASVRSVPIIDLTLARSKAIADRQFIAAEIDEACRNIGFLVISGHGVPDELIARTERLSQAFFDLSDDVKRRYKRDLATGRGYTEMGDSALAYSSGDMTCAPDYREGYTINQPDFDSTDPYYNCERGRAVFTPNLYPEEVLGLKETWIDYYRAMEQLSALIMQLFALALGLDEHFFDDKIDRHMTNFMVSNYPEQTKAPLANQIRAGAHSDWGSLTILKAEDKPGGLQVLTKEGVWVAVPIIPGTFVVNIGDLMAQWTNDAWVSTVHRVVNPPPAAGGEARRQSLVFFHQPNYDAMIECIPSCAQGKAAKYRPVTSGDYLEAKIRSAYGIAT